MRYALNLLCTAALVGCVAPVAAQDAPRSAAPSAAGDDPKASPGPQAGSTGSDQAGRLEEVVVTAQKREQSLQSVPVAVTAITAETLVNRNVATVSDLTRLAPSLTVTQSNTPANASINLRGIGTYAFSVGVEPSVAVIVDDVALLQQSQAFSGLSDIARIEVLRGPQGTLFGRSAAAGAINIVSQDPSARLTGTGGFTLTDDSEKRVEGMISGPVADGVGFRLNGFYDSRRGDIHNLQTGHRLNNGEDYGVRGRVSLTPSSALAIDLTASYSVDNTHGTARPLVAVPAGATLFGTPIAPYLNGITPGLDNRNVRFNIEPSNRTKQFLGSGRATLDLGGARLVSVSSYQDWKFRFLEDYDLSTAPVLSLADGIFAGGPFHARQFTQELRLVSTGKRTLDYVLGAYYSNGRTYRSFNRGPAGSAVAAQWSANAGTETFAAFAQSTLNIGQTTHVDGGLRFNRQNIDVAFQNLIVPAAPPANNATCIATCSGKNSDNTVTGKIALRQDLTQGVMAYASFATGYKGPGFDVSSGFTPLRARKPVLAERSHAYELGLKSRFLDNRIQVNIAGFWTDYKNFQAQSGQVLPDNTIQVFLNNVGKLRTRGVELEMSAKPTRDLRLDGALSYTDAVIRSYPNAPCYAGQSAAQGCRDLDGSGPSTATGQDLAGIRLANAPRIKWNVGATYNIMLPNLPYHGFVGADFSYQGAVNYDLLRNPLSVQKGYGILNATFGVEPGGPTGLRVAFFVNNVLNKHYAANIFPASGGSTGLLAAVLPREARRYVGVKARFAF